MPPLRTLAGLFFLLAPAFAGAAQPLPLLNGLNRVDLDGNGRADLVVIARRENGNAHGFDVVTFHIEDGELLQVPLFDGNDEAQFATVGGGADCLLHDLRLLPGAAGEPVALIRADRTFGESYADAAEVTFTWYALRRNSDGEIGRPAWWFERVRRTKADKPHCDVGEAFDALFATP
ncbi:MAG: carbapenem self-resistance protein CarG family protein [Pseudomonadota bacterium]|jgi:hypothetical protein